MPEFSLPVPKPNTQAAAAPKPDQPVALQHQSPVRKWAGLGVLSLGLAIVIIDTTLLNVSLSYIIKDLRTDLQSLQWVITAYALVLAALTITGGRLGDLYGRRKMFMWGAVIFAAGSFLASISRNVGVLLLGESIIEGFGAALMMPATASLVVANFKGKERATAFGVWGAVAGASSAIGPLLGGYLATHYSWRWGFRINVFVGLIVILGSLLLINESRDERKPRLDFGGVIFSSLSLLGITYGIIESSTYGWWKAKQALVILGHQLSIGSLSIVPLALAAGTVLLALFFWWEARMERQGKSPLMSLKLLKNRQFTSGTLAVAILTLGMTGTFFALPIYLQAVKGLDAFHTGLVLVPISIALLVVAPLASVLSHKISPKYLIQFGLLLSAAAAFLIRAGITTTGSTNRLLPGLALFGVGMGFVMAPISALTLSAVPVDEAGEASGVNNTMRQVGTSLGAAIIGAAVITMVGSFLAKGIQNSPIIPDAAKSTIIQNVSRPSANVEFSASSGTPAGTPPQIANEIQQLATEATTKATRDGYIYTAMFILLGFAVGLFLPKTSVHDEEQHLNQDEHARDPHLAKKFVAALAVTILAFAGGIWLLHNSANQVIATTTGAAETVAEIRNLFSPQQSAPKPATEPPPAPAASSSPYSSFGLAPTATTTPTAVPTSTPEQAPPVPPKPAAAPLPEITQNYRNETLGFSLIISSRWQVQATNSPNKVLIVGETGSSYSIESYDNFDGTLQDVQSQLAGAAHYIRSGQFAGQPALLFSAPRGNAHGVAVVYNNRLFYIFGPSLSSAPISSFNFL